MAMVDLESFYPTVLGLVGLVIMILIYFYMEKLEATGCACAEHPYRKFIKTYSLFAIFFLAFLILVPANYLAETFGEAVGFMLVLVKFLFSVATIVFYVYAIMYVRYLMREKCKCSEDMRRDVMYWWAIIEIAILAVLIILPLFSILKAGSVGVAMTRFKGAVKEMPAKVISSQMNPLRGAKKASNAVKKAARR